MSSETSTETKFKAYPKQLQFIEAVFSGKYSFLTFGGGMGGGKSFVSIAILLMLARMYPKSKWCIIRESLPTLKRTTIETFKKLVPESFLQSYNQSEHIAQFTNGSQIMFMPEDYYNDKDFDRFKGLEVNGFLLEQIEELQESLLNICLIRSGRNRVEPMPKPIILATVNPTQTWVKQRIYEADIRGTLPSDWYYLRSVISDNPALSEDQTYMDQLNRLDPISYARYVDGDWSAFAVNNPFAYAFDELKHVVSEQECEYNSGKYLQLSFDFNIDPITCVVGQDLNFIDEFRLEKSDIYELCDRIKAKYPKAVFIVTGDATGRASNALTKGNLNYYTVIKQQLQLADTQMKQPSINPAVEDRRVLTNSMLQNEPIRISARCKYLIEDLKFVEVNEKGDIDKAKDKRRSHLLDCFGYYLNTFYKNYLKYN